MAQPSIPGTDIGKSVMPYGSDGSDWIALLVSGLGALQVELASLPTGAVTIADGADVTLGALADALVAAGAVGSVSGKLRRLTTDLDALLTELKLKANLLDTQPVSAASLPLPSSAATETTLDAIKTAVEIIDGFGDAQNLIFGYNDRFAETKPAASVNGTTTVSSSSPPADEVWVVTNIAVQHNDSTSRKNAMHFYDGTTVHLICRGPAKPEYETEDRQGFWVLKQGDYIQGEVTSLGTGFYVWLYIMGYKMKIA